MQRTVASRPISRRTYVYPLVTSRFDMYYLQGPVHWHIPPQRPLHYSIA